MSAKLVELRDQLVIDAGVEGDPKFPIPRLNRMIALAERYVQTELNALGFKKWEKSLTVTKIGSGSGVEGFADSYFNSATKNVAVATIPFTHSAVSYLKDILESPSSILFVSCDFYSAPTHAYGLAYEVDKDRFKESLMNTYLAPTKKSPIFMRLGNKLWVAPYADSTYNLQSITVFYYKVITDITLFESPLTTADDNTTEIPVEFEEFIIKKAKLEIDIILEKVNNRSSITRQIQQNISSAYQKFAGKQKELNRASMRDNQTKMQ